MPWEALVDDESKDTYYHNTETGETTWDKPADFDDAPVAPQSKWEALVDEESKETYYHNTETGETTWDKPADFDDAPVEQASEPSPEPQKDKDKWEEQEKGLQDYAEKAEAGQSKRKRGLGYDDDGSTTERLGNDGVAHHQSLDHQAADVASHYNKRQDMHRELNSESRVTRLKNFNNWLKAVLIGEYTKQGANVLDFCCGKGGDLNKWNIANVDFVTMVDIAAGSIKVSSSHDLRRFTSVHRMA